MIICRSKRRLGRRCAELPYGTVFGKLFHWRIRGCVGNWVKIRPQNSPIMQFDTTPTQSQTRPQKSQSGVHSPLQKREGNWADLTYAKTSGTVNKILSNS